MNGGNIYGVNIKPQSYTAQYVAPTYMCVLRTWLQTAFFMTNVTDVVTQGRNEPVFADRLLNDILAARHRLNNRDHNNHHHHCRLQGWRQRASQYVADIFVSDRTLHAAPLDICRRIGLREAQTTINRAVWRRRRTLLKEEVRQGTRRIPFSETNVRSFPTKKVPSDAPSGVA